MIKLALALGIDTGGTYTDIVIIDLDNQGVVAKAKAPTTYEDLTRGLINSMQRLNFDRFAEIKLVALSTTLATNAVVEGRGSEVGLILIGEQPVGEIPLSNYAVVAGGHDIRGNAREELDLEEVAKALEQFRGKVNAVAISGFASVRNPEHELKVSALVQQKLQLPVVCGHQLTTSLGFYERTITAILNAQLIPIITELIASVKKVLTAKGIDAHLMIVKGDGSLMSESMAVEKPIETLLSGPAASIIGATTLTDRQAALVLDMGGTTTDIALLNQGIPRINPEGARVGGWRTRVEAADIDTSGLGGDSYLRLNKDSQLLIGPQKVCPLSFAAAKYPYLLAQFRNIGDNFSQLRLTNALDGYMLKSQFNEVNLTELEKRALAHLALGPSTLLNLAVSLEQNPFSFNLERLVNAGLVIKVALTPTDILHANGAYQEWNQEIAILGVQFLARLMGKSFEDTLQATYNLVVENLCLIVLRAVLNFEGAKAELVDNLAANYFINKLLSVCNDDILNIRPSLRVPIIGIGAPVGAYLPAVAAKLNAQLIIPEHSDVANAIGAATGRVMAKIKMTINSSPDGFTLYSQWERQNFAFLEDAKQYAIEQAEKQAMLLAQKAGTVNFEISNSCRDIFANAGYGPHIETLIEVIVIGRPSW